MNTCFSLVLSVCTVRWIVTENTGFSADANKSDWASLSWLWDTMMDVSRDLGVNFVHLQSVVFFIKLFTPSL